MSDGIAIVAKEGVVKQINRVGACYGTVFVVVAVLCDGIAIVAEEGVTKQINGIGRGDRLGAVQVTGSAVEASVSIHHELVTNPNTR